MPRESAPPGSGSSFLRSGVALAALLGLGLLDQQAVTPLIVAIADGLGALVSEVGLAVSAYSIASSAAALLTGPIADRRGRRRFLPLAAGLVFLASVLTAAVPRFEAFLAARLLAGMAGGLIATLVVAVVADLVPYSRRGAVLANMMAAGGAAAILGQAAAPFLANRAGYGAVYAAFAGCALLVALLLFALPRHAPDRTAPAAAKARGGVRAALGAYLRFLGDGRLNAAAFAGFFVNGGLVGVALYASGWLQQERGFSLPEIGVLYGVLGAVMMAAQPVSGRLADRFGKRRFLLFVSVPAILIIPAAPMLRGAPLVVALLLIGAFGMARNAPLAALRSELVPAERRASYLALAYTLGQLGIATAAALGARLYAIGFDAVCWAMAGFAALSVLMILRVREPEGVGLGTESP